MSRRAPTARRALLCGASASALLLAAPAAGTAKAAELDGDLIALLEEARALANAPRVTSSLAPLFTRRPWEAALDAAARLPARTPEGLHRKAEAVAEWLAGDDWRTSTPWDCTGETAVAWSLLRDLLPFLAPVPMPRRLRTDEEVEAIDAAPPMPVVLPDVPDLPWLWSNARAAIQGLPVQGYRLTTAATLAARRAEEAGDVVRAHNLYLVASVAVQQQIDGLGVETAWNTQVYPDVATLAAETGGLA